MIHSTDIHVADTKLYDVFDQEEKKINSNPNSKATLVKALSERITERENENKEGNEENKQINLKLERSKSAPVAKRNTPRAERAN